VKFQLTSHAVTNAIGGNFRVVAGQGNEEIFGAIVTLSGPTDFPNSLDLSTPDVLGTTLLAPSNQVSGEVTAPLTLALTPGWYALIFGGDLFGATGDGRAPGQFSGDTNIDSPLYFHWNRFTNISTYVNDGNSLHNELLLTGNVVPEPSTFLIAACFAVATFLSRTGAVASESGCSLTFFARQSSPVNPRSKKFVNRLVRSTPPNETRTR
jgi:hypothetical protein